MPDAMLLNALKIKVDHEWRQVLHCETQLLLLLILQYYGHVAF